MRFLLLLSLVLQLNISGFANHNPQENHAKKTQTAEKTFSDEHSYNQFRYYDPSVGNYISQDPIGLQGGMQLYNYVHDINSWIDKFGLAKIKDEYSSMDEYWKAKEAPTQVTPGTRETVDIKPSSRANESYVRVTHYDEYGKIEAQTHYTSHGDNIHPNPHHHRYEIGGNGIPSQVRNPEDGTKMFPGEYNNKNNSCH